MDKKEKVVKPQDTIDKLRSVYRKLDLTYEEIVSNVSKIGTHSNRYNYSKDGIVLYGTNGKGANEIYATASVMAEGLERIMSFFNFHLIMLKQPAFLLRTKIDYGDRLNEFQVSRQELKDSPILNYVVDKFGFTEKDVEDRLDYLDFFFSRYKMRRMYDVTNPSKWVDVPAMFMNLNSNGLAAGNTYEECFYQCAMELFERYSMSEVLHNTRDSHPTITKESLKKYDAYKYVKKFEETYPSYTLEIKDLSLDNKYPVLAVLVIEPKTERYFVKIGASFNFNIALERCFTELFQGYEDLENLHFVDMIDYDDVDPAVNELSGFKNSGCYYPETFFIPSKFVDAEELTVFKEFSTHEESFDYITNVYMEEHDIQIYANDYSVDGFYAINLFSPQLSPRFLFNFDSGTRDDLRKIIVDNQLMDSADEVLQNLFNLDSVKKETIELFLSKMRKLKEDDKMIDLMYFIPLHMNVDKVLNINFLIPFLEYYVGNYEEAYDYFKRLFPVLTFDNDSNETLFKSIKLYLQILSKSGDKEASMQAVKAFYPRLTYFRFKKIFKNDDSPIVTLYSNLYELMEPNFYPTLLRLQDELDEKVVRNRYAKERNQR